MKFADAAFYLGAPTPPLIHAGVAIAFAGFFTIGFCVYWFVSSFSDMIISYFRRKPSTSVELSVSASRHGGSPQTFGARESFAPRRKGT